MSAGPFEFSRYQTDTFPTEQIMIAKIQPETGTLVLGGAVNLPGGPTVTLPLRVRISGGQNELGVKARFVSLKWATVADTPDGYSPNGILRVPIMGKALWDAIDPGITTGSYLGSPVVVTGKTPEYKL